VLGEDSHPTPTSSMSAALTSAQKARFELFCGACHMCRAGQKVPVRLVGAHLQAVALTIKPADSGAWPERHDLFVFCVVNGAGLA